MKRLLSTVVLLFGFFACSYGQHIGLTGNLYAALQNWSKVGDGSDSKIGFGGGGMVGLALVFDSSMTFAVGPHVAYNSWTADYSKKSVSFAENVVFNMEDAGSEASLLLDDIAVFMGVGESKMEAYYTLKGGTKVPYPTLDGKKAKYTTAGLSYNLSPLFIGVCVHSYADFAKDASRIEFRLGLHL
ncbi:MAG: hypothetical protein NTU47_18680 [Ignavibacteriales bacterium]|nr:hypothetical protein [Ignavibacteriales bacterium]